MKIRLPSRYPTTLRPGGPTLRDGVWVIQKDPNDLQRFENFLRETKECLTVDTETKGHNVRKEHARYKARATSAQISCEEFPRIYIDNYRECEGNILLLKWWAENAEKKKDGHNIKYEGHVFANHGIRLRGVDCDTIVCDYLLDTSREGRHDLETALYDWGITDTILPGYSETFSWHPPKKNGEPKKNAELKPHYEWWDEGDHDRVIKYATKDVFYGRKLRQHHEARLRAIEWVPGKSYWDYYRTIDLPMLDVLLSIELEGAPVDQEHLLRLQEEFGTEIAGAEREFLHRLAEEGVPQEFLEEFNLGSPQQLGHVLYDILGYECPKWTGKRPGEGQRSVDEVALNLLVDKQGCSILEPLFKAREYGKLHSTYAVALYDYAQEYRGRVHTNLNQIGTATMRLSSSKPNLQNIPTRTKLGKEIRKAFIAPPGEVILCADYSQIELRVAAHKSGDPTLVRYFMEGKDPHALTGYNLFEEIRADIDSRGWDIDTKEVQKYIKTTYDELRGRGKTWNFMVLYGGGVQRAVDVFKVPEDEAQEKINAFFDTYPGIRAMIEKSQRRAHERGYITTIINRRCHLPNIHSMRFGERKQAERQATNYEIQGSAQDIIKMGMIVLHREDRLRRLGYRQFLQIHDEVLGLVPQEAAEEARPIVEKCMGESYRYFGFKGLRVETPVEAGTGKNWAEAKH